MTDRKKIVAINGSPHAGIGNTSIMIEMMRPTFEAEGFDIEHIYIAEKSIEYCVGCALCMEKGKCWIDDDHRRIVRKMLDADGVILASPVYFFHVTAQMKTFIDRSLAYGHKPRKTWKPGLAVCVSAGQGETDTGAYLSNLLRVYGCFSMGTLTGIATQPGGFVGKEHLEWRAAGLAGSLASAIRDKRRLPATDQDLKFYHFMGNLVRSHREGVMKDDFRHWTEAGLYDGFEAYIKQTLSPPSRDPAMREAWVKQMIDKQKAKKKAAKDTRAGSTPAEPTAGPAAAKSCQDLLNMMPLGFNPTAAQGLEADMQFEVSGDEEFTAHLSIRDGACAYHDGPADEPDVTINTPAQVWLAIAKGEKDGQSAFMAGEYKVEGDLSLLMKMSALFGR